jgi:hypothetical protein
VTKIKTIPPPNQLACGAKIGAIGEGLRTITEKNSDDGKRRAAEQLYWDKQVSWRTITAGAAIGAFGAAAV